MTDKPTFGSFETTAPLEHLGDLALARRLVREAFADNSQQQIANRFSAFMGEHANCLERTCVPGHITASACVVDLDRNETLLLLHKKLKRWLQPGGHADGDGNLAHVAWREATEETGIAGLKVVLPAIDLDIHPIPAFGSDPAHLHYDVRFVVLAPDQAEAHPNDESTNADWFAPDDKMIAGNDDVERLVTRSFELLHRR